MTTLLSPVSEVKKHKDTELPKQTNKQKNANQKNPPALNQGCFQRWMSLPQPTSKGSSYTLRRIPSSSPLNYFLGHFNKTKNWLLGVATMEMTDHFNAREKDRKHWPSRLLCTSMWRGEALEDQVIKIFCSCNSGNRKTLKRMVN